MCRCFKVNSSYYSSNSFTIKLLLHPVHRKLESAKGSRLLTVADFHVGSDVTTMVSHDTLSTDPLKKPALRDPSDSRPPAPLPRTRRGCSFPLQAFSTRFNKTPKVSSRTCTVIGTMDGGLGMLIPLDERMFRRLSLLQQIMVLAVKMPLLTNPREYRAFHSTRFQFNRQNGVLDGTILWMYPTLDPQQQEELAEVLGVTSYLIKENLREIECFGGFF